MKHLLAVLVSGIFMMGANSASFALDLNMGEKHVTDAETTLNDMNKEGEDKVSEAKDEAKEQSMSEKIQSKSKDKVNEKIDDMQSGMKKN
ncbi:hypothetical protein [Candidatus Nitrospira salsa]|nr:MAG: hypothetical protein NPIRA01_40330 [Nitrospirales bacterium]